MSAFAASRHSMLSVALRMYGYFNSIGIRGFVLTGAPISRQFLNDAAPLCGRKGMLAASSVELAMGLEAAHQLDGA